MGMTMASFQDLHHAEAPLVLPNAWDVGSALAFAAAGFPAIGTTSFGISVSTGSPDGGRSSKQATAALTTILGRLPVHLTADIEDGYSENPSEVADFVAELAAHGVVGVNIEDSTSGHLVDPAIFASKVLEVKRRAPSVFVNARVDNLWFAEQATVDAVLLRIHAYEDAGADGIFVPGLADPEGIRAIAGGTELPVNVLAHPFLTVAELGELGVRRVSSGSLPYRAAVDAALETVTALRAGLKLPEATAYAEVQRQLVAFNARPPRMMPTPD
ncbi:isocitrate lyase/PEP mutase family protein [Arthrobacter antibioticus]|uniref:isocitrate lyase/PEP mutase family protein n=1 Tax=Arthrobacter sp. H35-MC1 TaxID=3046203 RepID=UPI0032D8F26A